MPEQNVELVRAVLDAYNRGDFEGISDFAAPDCTLDWSRSIGPQRGVYGIDELSLWSIRDGAVVRVTLYQEREEALEATGLSE